MRQRTVLPGRSKTVGPVRVALYLRVSTAQQIEGYGLQVQDEVCRKQLDSEFGAGNYEITVFTDGAVSGKLASRPDLDEMNRQILDGQFDVVCFGKLDRIGRTMRNIHRWVYDTTDLGVRVITGDGRVDSDDDMFGIVMSLLAFMAELEHSMILERTMGGREQKLQSGGWPSGVTPYGLALDGTGKDATPVFNEDEIQVINRAVSYVVDDRETKEGAARRLNERGDRTRSGKPWDGSAVDRLLSGSHLLEGVVYFRKTDGRSKTKLNEDGEPLYGPTVAIPVPRILEPERAAALAAVMKECCREHRPNEKYPLSGRIKGSCGKVYVGAYRTNQEQRMYRCQGVADAKPCGDVYLEADAVEAGVWAELSDFLQDPERLRDLAQEWATSLPGSHDKYTERAAGLRVQVGDRQAALARIIKHCANLGLDEEATRDATGELQMELTTLRQSLAEAEAWLAEYSSAQTKAENMISLMQSARGKMLTLDLARQAEIFDMLNIEVTPEDHRFQRRAGAPCRVTEWHVTTKTPVPDEPDDEQWETARSILFDIHGPELGRVRLDLRQALNGMLHRLRTGTTWEELDRSYGSVSSLKKYQGAWFTSGAWKLLTRALTASGGGSPAYQPPSIPGLSVAGILPADLLNEPASDQTVFSETVQSEAGMPFELAVA